jgi:Domain of unknown function (DUF4190)
VSQPPPGPPPGPTPPPPPTPPAPPGWGGPPPGTIYPGAPSSAPPTSGLAVAALVTGLFFWCCAIPGIVAIVLGHIALEQIDDSGGVTRGRGMAIAGIVLGWVGIGIVGLLVLAWFINVLTI